MPERREQPGRVAFGDFLAHLRTKGFVIGIDQELRVQRLLARLEGECSPEDLPTLLCPIIASSEKEQREFYREFDLYLQQHDNFSGAEVTPDPVPAIPPRPKRLWTVRRVALSAAGLVSILLLTWFLIQIPREEQTNLPPPTPTPGSSPKTTPPLSGVVIRKERVPIPGNSDSNQTVNESDTVLKFRNPLRGLAMLIPLAGWLLWMLWRRWRQRPVIEKSQGRKPPFSVPIELKPERWRIDHLPLFEQAARVMRRRQLNDQRNLDLPATIEATVAAHGYPRFRYRSGDRPPEYLILIHRISPRDHQAEWFSQIARSLAQSGLFVQIWFYQVDPRICQSAETGEAVYLTQLQRRFPSHRLIVLGDGRRLLDPLTGALASWIDLVQEWTESAIMTPLTPLAWNRFESTLEKTFPLFPGTLAGLARLADHYDQPLRDQDPGDDPEERVPPEVTDGVTTGELENYLGRDGYRWLCACAFYPELHWDLTLSLARLTLGEENPETDQRRLWRLIRLPWFREGMIPDEIRLPLVESLEKRDPLMARRVREHLIGILESQPTVEGTFAADERRLDLVVQRVALARNRRERREALRQIEHLSPGELRRDFTLIRLIDQKPASLLALILPNRLRPAFYPDGLPLYPVKWWAGLIVSALVMASFLVSVEGLVHYHRSHPLSSSAGPTLPDPTAYFEFEMVTIPAGSFLMGSPAEEKGRFDNEGPQRQVSLRRFEMGRHEVTQRLWQAVMGKNPSQFKGESLPVETVSWNDAQEFCRRLNQLLGLTSEDGYRLPTEAEWEYAARAGTITPFAFGTTINTDLVNYDGNYPYGDAPKGVYREKTIPVGSLGVPNAFGLFDMHGNVWEWCQDQYRDSYEGAPNDGRPWTGLDEAAYRVIRGGGWRNYAVDCRSAIRDWPAPGGRDHDLGFRLSRTLPSALLP